MPLVLLEEGLINEKVFFSFSGLFVLFLMVSDQYGYTLAVVTVGWREQNGKSSMTPCVNTSMDLQQCLKCFLIWRGTYTNVFSCLSAFSPCTICLLSFII